MGTSDEWVLPWTAERMPAEAGNQPGTWWVYNAIDEIVAENLHEPAAKMLAKRPQLWNVLTNQKGA
jgi:hypothetical protein